ncbi:MAG: hypothetical protein AAFY31_10990 [Pseudomonadota bacterium]
MSGTVAEFQAQPHPSSDVIILQVSDGRAVRQRAMTGLWQSVVPPDPFIKRATFSTCVWLALGALTLTLSVHNIAPSYLFAGLIGATFLIGVFGCLQRTRMERFWNVFGDHWDRAGDTRATFGPDGIEQTDKVSRRHLTRPDIDAITGRRGIILLRSDISKIAIPNASLPELMFGRGFRAQLALWRDG